MIWCLQWAAVLSGKLNSERSEESHINEDDACKREKQIKGWIRQKKIDLINSINPQWIDLSFEVFQIEKDI